MVYSRSFGTAKSKMATKSIEDAYIRGYSDYQRMNKGKNPYKKGTDEWREYQRGVSEAEQETE